MLRNRILTGF